MNVFTKLLRFLRKMFFVILFFLKLFFLKGKARKASPERTLEPGTELELRLKLLFNLSGVFQYGAFRAWKNHKIALTGDAFGICEFFTILMKKPAATQLSKIYFSIWQLFIFPFTPSFPFFCVYAIFHQKAESSGLSLPSNISQFRPLIFNCT